MNPLTNLPVTRPPLHVVPSRLPPPRRSILSVVVHALLDWAAQHDDPLPLRRPDTVAGAEWDAKSGCYVANGEHLCNGCQRPMRTEASGWRCVLCALYVANMDVPQPVVPLALPPGHTGNPNFF